jgi:hemerythrin superfamily protein
MATGDVIAVLEAQHQQVKAMLEQVSSASGAQKGTAFGQLKRMAVAHETSEEETIYPALRATGGDGQRLAEAREAEQAEAMQVITRLEGMDPASEEFSRTFSELRQAMLAHAEAEEREVFPLLQRTQTEAALREMARPFEVAQQQGAPDQHAKDIEREVRDALRKAS